MMRCTGVSILRCKNADRHAMSVEWQITRLSLMELRGLEFESHLWVPSAPCVGSRRRPPRKPKSTFVGVPRRTATKVRLTLSVCCHDLVTAPQPRHPKMSLRDGSQPASLIRMVLQFGRKFPEPLCAVRMIYCARQLPDFVREWPKRRKT